MKEETVIKILDLLVSAYPDAECALTHKNTFQLLTATVLSAQTTDKSVNKVTPELFKRFPTPLKLSQADSLEVENLLHTVGMYKTKAKHIIELSKILTEKYGGRVPCDYESLTALPGVGRKTANVVLSVGFNEQRIAVDTHVFRVANRIGLGRGKDVLKTEESLMKNIPKERWVKAHHLLIFHGRNICDARRPRCEECIINGYCQYFKTEGGK
ncbi:MAG: endonuclease III [Anaerovoracaceae bacterium]|nr:endonuclease III [Clostridiales bacterium]